MSLTILHIGECRDEPLYRRVATPPQEPLAIRAVDDTEGARLWAGLYQPDLVMVDLRRVNEEGVEFMRGFRGDPACRDIPLLAVVAEGDRRLRGEALLSGANDLLTAPLEPSECGARITNLITVSAQRRIIKQQARWLKHGSTGLTREIQARERETLLRLARAGEYRDEVTGTHILRIGKTSRLIAETLGLPAKECEIIEAAAPMHDIGKIGIADSLLRKNGALTPEERRVLQTHTVIGHGILKDSKSVYLQRGAEIALSHHEKFDGTGYPHGLRGEQIPIAARIVAVADVYDALASDRPYKPRWPQRDVIAYLNEQKGTHFDPACVDAFLSRLEPEVVSL